MMQLIWGFVQKELRQTLRDKRMWALLFLAPCMQMILFGIALTTEARNIRLDVRSEAADTVLDTLQSHALASGWFIDAGPGGKADAVLYPPAQGVTRSMARGEGQVQMLVDATNMTRAQSIERYMRGIVQEELQRNAPRQAPLLFNVRLQYNPTLRSAVFMVPGIMSLVMCLTTIILTSMGVAREKEIGTFETILAAPVGAIDVILGKSIPYMLLGLMNLPLILGVAVMLFEVPLRGPLWVLLLASVVFIAATVAIGILISTTVRTQQQALMGGFLFLFPSVLVSGLMFPVENMPWLLQLVSYSNPLTYYMELLRNIMLKGGDPTLVLRNVSVLIGMALFLGWLSMKRFRTTL